MKKLNSILTAIILCAGISIFVGCEPNGDKNSTDTENSILKKEYGSSRYPGMDSNHMMEDTIYHSDSVRH